VTEDGEAVDVISGLPEDVAGVFCKPVADGNKYIVEREVSAADLEEYDLNVGKSYMYGVTIMSPKDYCGNAVVIEEPMDYVSDAGETIALKPGSIVVCTQSGDMSIYSREELLDTYTLTSSGQDYLD
jgi:hypothetical protein